MPNALRVAGGIFVVAIALSISAADPGPLSETAEDELVLKEAKAATEGPGLLEFFRRRVPTEKDQARITELIRQLGSSDFQGREKASHELATLGPVALPELRKAQKGKDAEVKRRAAECIETIERKASPTVTAAAVRLLKARAPAGATGVLLAFLPHANDDSLEEEIAGALLALGVRDGKVDPLLAAALDDPMPNRRAVAAMILGRYGTADQKEAVRKLLRDPDPRIRLRAAQGLVAAREKDAVPLLVGLLSDGSMDIARQAEDLLTRIAGDKAPKGSLEEDKGARRKYREAWEGWWKSAEAKLDLAKADVDLVSTNPIQQSRKVAQQFVDAVFKADTAMLRRTSAVPFSLPGMQEFKNGQVLQGIVHPTAGWEVLHYRPERRQHARVCEDRSGARKTSTGTTSPSAISGRVHPIANSGSLGASGGIRALHRESGPCGRYRERPSVPKRHARKAACRAPAENRQSSAEGQRQEISLSVPLPPKTPASPLPFAPSPATIIPF
jgi:HEAT repeat protein